MAIEAAHYEEDRQALMKDPIVIKMEEELYDPSVPFHTMVDSEDHPTFAFMQLCNREYSTRGGKIGAHIGGVAEAIVRLRNQRSQEEE